MKLVDGCVGIHILFSLLLYMCKMFYNKKFKKAVPQKNMLLGKWHGGENRYNKVIFIQVIYYIIFHVYDVQENPTKFQWSGKSFQGSDVFVQI